MTEIHNYGRTAEGGQEDRLTSLLDNIQRRQGELVLLNRIVSLSPMHRLQQGISGNHRTFLSDAYAGRIAGPAFLHHHPSERTALHLPHRKPYAYTGNISFPVTSYHNGAFKWGSNAGKMDFTKPKDYGLQRQKRIFFGVNEFNGKTSPQELIPGLLARLTLFEILVGEAEIMRRAEEYRIDQKDVERCLAELK